IQINPGVTLTVSGTNDNGWGPLGSNPGATSLTTNDSMAYKSTYYVGTKLSDSSGTTRVTNTISGVGGTLVLNNTNNELNVRQFNSANSAHPAILNMFGLDNLVANLGRIRVGDGEVSIIIRADGYLTLAKTNNITLTGSNY